MRRFSSCRRAHHRIQSRACVGTGPALHAPASGSMGWRPGPGCFDTARFPGTHAWWRVYESSCATMAGPVAASPSTIATTGAHSPPPHWPTCTNSATKSVDDVKISSHSTPQSLNMSPRVLSTTRIPPTAPTGDEHGSLYACQSRCIARCCAERDWCSRERRGGRASSTRIATSFALAGEDDT